MKALLDLLFTSVVANYNMDQFAIQHAVGDMDLSFFGGESTMSCLFNPNSVLGPLEPGGGVGLVDLGAADSQGAPIVDMRSAATTPIFGVKVRDTRMAQVPAGQVTEIAVRGAVVWFQATAALNRGVPVTLDPANPGNVIAQGTNAFLGITLDKAAANGMVRVWLQSDGLSAGVD
ncbi:MAG: hypothetical protein ACLQMF_20170 [Rectinemataceae bacterium]